MAEKTRSKKIASNPKRPKLGLCDLSHFPQRLKKHDIKEKKSSRRSCVLAVSRDNDHARSYVHGGSGFEATKKWLDSLANVCASDSAGHSPLIINGMIKTGKTAWLREILPTMIRENPSFGDASSQPAAIMEVNCTQLSHSSPYAFLRDLFVTFVALLAKSVDVDISDLYEVLPPDGDGEGFKSRFSLAFKRISQCLEGRHVFFLLDEIQAWFTWYEPDKRNVDVAAVNSMRQVLKSFLINDSAPFCHFAVTGSCMAEAWLNIVYCPPNGRPVKTSACVNLPARVSRRAFTKAIEIIAERYPSVNKASIDGCAKMADRNPALFSHLVGEFTHSTQEESTSMTSFCQEVISSKIGEELWNDVAVSFFLMPRDKREILYNLVHRHIGITREVFRDLCAGAWHYHLSPFCKADSEDFIHLPSRPFQAFVEQVIGKRGELLIKPGTTIGILPLHLLLPSFSKLVMNFGEWCRIQPINYVPIRKGLAWFVTALSRVFKSLEAFKGHDFVQLILSHSYLYNEHKERISSAESFSETSYAIFIALRHIFGHEIPPDDNSPIAMSFPVSLDEAYDHLS